MNKLLFISILALISSATIAQNAHIQVKADPGISIYLDGKLIGVTNAEFGGIIIQNIEPGTHTIEARKEGFRTQSDNIRLDPGQVLTYNLDDFFERISIRERGEEDEDLIERNIGNLKVQSLPVELEISIPGLSINYKKQKDSWTAENVPSGEFASVFSWNDKKLSHMVEIKPEMESHYLVNMVDGKVELLGIYPISEDAKVRITTRNPHTVLYSVSVPVTYVGLKYHYENRVGGYVGVRYGTRYSDESKFTYLSGSAGISYKVNKVITPYIGGGFLREKWPVGYSGNENETIWIDPLAEVGIFFNFYPLVIDIGGGWGDQILLNVGIGLSF